MLWKKTFAPIDFEIVCLVDHQCDNINDILQSCVNLYLLLIKVGQVIWTLLFTNHEIWELVIIYQSIIPKMTY